MPTTRRISRAEIVATHLSMDAGDIRDYEYHRGRTAAPVFGIGDRNYTVASPAELRGIERYHVGLVWVPVVDAKTQAMAAKSRRVVYVTTKEM
jgi:hypothetical protein